MIPFSSLHTDLSSLIMQNYTKLLTFLRPENANHNRTQQLKSNQSYGCGFRFPCLIGLLAPVLAKEKKDGFVCLCGHCCHLRNTGV